MKVIILAGGWGTRLGKLSESIPKPMVKIGNMPVIWHIMKLYSKYGCNEFIIALGVKSDVIKNYFLNYEYNTSDFTLNLSDGNIQLHSTAVNENWKITFVETGLNTLKGGRLKRVEEYVDEEINMITYGDGLSDINIKNLLSFHKRHGEMITISGVRPPARFGEIIEKKGKILSFQEKPQTSRGLINGGFMVFNKELFNYLTDDENCDFEFGVLDKLAQDKKVMVYKHTGNWECMDHERDVDHLNKLWNENKAFWV